MYCTSRKLFCELENKSGMRRSEKKIFAAFWWFKLAWYFLLLFSQKFPCSVRRTFLFVFVQVTEPVSESSSLLSTSSINNHPPKNARFTHRSIPLAAWQRGLPREKGMSQGPQAAFQYTERELKEKHHSMTHHSPKYFSTDPPAAVTFWNTVISQKHYFWVGFKHAWYFFLQVDRCYSSLVFGVLCSWFNSI